MAYIMAPAFSPAFSPVPSPAPSRVRARIPHAIHPFNCPPPPCPCPPPPRRDSVFSPEVVADLRLLIIFSSVLVTIILLYLLFFLGRIRRSIRWKYYIAYITKISYVFLPLSITYIMGVLHRDNDPHPLYPVMAATLVYAYGGVVTISACDLTDNDETLGYFFRTFPLFMWTAWLMFLVFDKINYKSMVALVFTMACFIGLAMINASQTLEAFSKASKSKGLPSEVQPLVEHMEKESKLGDERPDPKSMRGFKYMVWGRPNVSQPGDERLDISQPGDERSDVSQPGDVTTLDEIWEWVPVDGEEGGEGERRSVDGEEGREGERRSVDGEEGRKRKRRFLAKCRDKDRLRDMCLSYALFRMLLVKFAGFPPPIPDHTNPIHPRRLIQEGKLVSKEAPQRVFQIIEVELNFLFDHFYTKSHVCTSYRFRDIWKNLSQILLIGAVALIAVPIIMEESLRHHYFRHLEAKVASSVLLMVVFMETIKYLMVHFSSRKLVWLLCTGIRETSSRKWWASITEKRIVSIWSIKSWLSSNIDAPLFSFFWPWQRKLGQYSFVNNYYRVPILARKPFSPLAKLVKLPRRGQRGVHVVPLSNQVKEAIISSLLGKHERNPEGNPEGNPELILNPSRGSDTIGWYKLWDKLPSGCKSETSDVSFILVWHIATSRCESCHPISLNDSEHKHFLVANQLSKYCAYLVAFIPQLLPQHHAFTLEREFDKAVKHADPSSSGVNGDNVIQRGESLYTELSRYFRPENSSEGWIILAEFWAEMLLYLASSDGKIVEHVEYLATGGEFITHLWVLLTHAGVGTPNSSSSNI